MKLIFQRGLFYLVPFFFLSFSIWGSTVNLSQNSTDLGGSSSKEKHNYQLTKEIIRAGEYSQRFELNHGECGAYKDWNDCENDRQRVERNYGWNGVNQTKWLGFSLYVEESISDKDLTTSLVQMKVNGWRDAIWMLRQINVSIILEFNILGAGTNNCYVGSAKSFKGKWNDIIIKTELAYEGGRKEIGESYTELYLNGKKVNECSRRYPIFTKESYENRPRDQEEFFLNYGLYNGFISKWLDKNKTKEVDVSEWKDVDEKTGTIHTSKTNEPFKYDWGVEIPKRVIYFDEMRIGNTKEEVDISNATGVVD